MAPSEAGGPTRTQAYLGIDIAKATFEVALSTAQGKPKHFANREEGFAQLSAWLSQQLVTEPADLHACLEATSHYGDALARFLYEHDYVVSVVNPAAIRAFARCELARTKTGYPRTGDS